MSLELRRFVVSALSVLAVALFSTTPPVSAAANSMACFVCVEYCFTTEYSIAYCHSQGCGTNGVPECTYHQACINEGFPDAMQCTFNPD